MGNPGPNIFCKQDPFSDTWLAYSVTVNLTKVEREVKCPLQSEMSTMASGVEKSGKRIPRSPASVEWIDTAESSKAELRPNYTECQNQLALPYTRQP